MTDYTRYDTETLRRMWDKAYAEYYSAAATPCGDGSKFLASPEAGRLRCLTDRCESIREELAGRYNAHE